MSLFASRFDSYSMDVLYATICADESMFDACWKRLFYPVFKRLDFKQY